MAPPRTFPIRYSRLSRWLMTPVERLGLGLEDPDAFLRSLGVGTETPEA